MAGSKPGSRRQAALERFSAGLREIYGDDLVSVVLYGSAASGELTDKNSNLNILIVIREASVPSLKKCRNFVNTPEFRSITPVFMTEAHIRSSLDVFPIEFLDMKDNYRVLDGNDPLAAVTVDPKNLRFQCEHEVKSRAITLKQSYIKAGASAAELSAMLFRSMTSMLHILRNALRLKGITPPYEKKEALAAVSEVFGIDHSAWQKIMDAKAGRVKLGRDESENLFGVFVGDLEKAAGLIDRI